MRTRNTPKVPFAKMTLDSINSADPTKPTVKPVPYVGVQFVAIPEFAGIATTVGQIFSAALAGEKTADEALAEAQDVADARNDQGRLHQVTGVLPRQTGLPGPDTGQPFFPRLRQFICRGSCAMATQQTRALRQDRRCALGHPAVPLDDRAAGMTIWFSFLRYNLLDPNPACSL